jgi:hypothetical protein
MSWTNIAFIIYLVIVLGFFSRSMHGWVDQFATNQSPFVLKKMVKI